ncbi:alpha-D-ribose 1-methylphosphonate 5-triphosphate synthase subunit PhnL [Dethiosulfatibacter aminovorans DSM 17477]|uniref:Alpha-D-ribose 1-methylphosphonate 5-triphosphate synthase subunit PhnL n=1 Tax=Dethiosulfatibacter aminovorans DSM 17477 TaxID=1121476 RepID=A0A1M6AYU8_9FIRM|nr:ATP-binding cassette domain-containing protein [Dethiosulfatibacter aminovorans]SHI41689.1 alpha-D-ribose 1-methylphosphonate 5-triphosphate synthase subunit PhnL [Dethiosulfatibacter aminovorans DSM 17477]
MNTLLKIENVSKSFTLHNLDRHIKACQNIGMEVKEGEFIGITGKSGSGKSSILKTIYRSYLPGEGSIYYNSKRFGFINLFEATERQMIYLRKYEIGYVSQFLNAMPRTTAREIVENSVLEMGRKKDEAKAMAERMLDHFELDRELWDSYPVNFSGGEKLRLNIASAMIKEPRLLLLDEPTASLDLASKERVRLLIETLKKNGTTMVGIFHDIEFMEGLCDREYNMEKGVIVA